MSGRGALLIFGIILETCAPSPRTAQPKPSTPARQLFLDEPFTLEGQSCKVSAAKSGLIESGALPYPKARVRPDVRALEVLVHCQDARGQTLDSHKVLPHDSVVLLALSGGRTLAPRPDDGEHAALIFELPEDIEPELPAARRFDTRTGESVVARERNVAKLSLRTQALALEVSLRSRYHDAALDVLVDQLARALAGRTPLTALARDAQAEAGLAELVAIYEEVRRRFQPARLELSQLSAQSAGERAITLSLTRPRNHESAFEVARFALTLSQGDGGALRVQSFDNREAARNALDCDGLKDDLRRELTLLPPASKHDQTCNALGMLLPAPCKELEAPLLSRALAVGARCGEPFETRPAKKAALPGDFQVTLRRGRPQSGLDRSPRYVLSLFHGGQVVFHGKHWVESQERADGRTDLALLAGLHERIRALDFFARHGGEYNAERCSPSDEQGDVMTVIAGNKQRMVLNRDGCRGPFSEGELTDLRRQVERIAGLSAWTQKSLASIDDRGAEQWAIAE